MNSNDPNNAVNSAWRDINKYLYGENKEIVSYNKKWVIVRSYVDTKETRLLNRELGLYMINRKGVKQPTY